LLIAVEDSGAGIAPAIRERLFELASTTKPMGLGVGLALSRDLIRAHDGELRAESSRLLGGARFVIELPLRPATAAS
jgi:signal transduction histidine kinase